VNLSEKKYADADVALGTFLLHRGELEEGEALLRDGLAWNPRSWPGQFELGRLELNQGHLDEALVAAQDAKELAPREFMVYRLLAAIHVRQKKYPELIVDLDAYLQLDPDSDSGRRAKELRAAALKQIATTTVSANK
jgi:tetratricopeptide (TPR) repeat protein